MKVSSELFGFVDDYSKNCVEQNLPTPEVEAFYELCYSLIVKLERSERSGTQRMQLEDLLYTDKQIIRDAFKVLING